MRCVAEFSDIDLAYQAYKMRKVIYMTGKHIIAAVLNVFRLTDHLVNFVLVWIPKS